MVITRDIEVRWGDMDALNHVNNTVFLRFIEEVRISFFQSIPGGWENSEDLPLLVNVNCNFRREIRYPATVRVTLRASRASAKRLLMEHEIRDVDDPDLLYADAEATAVWINRSTGRGIPLPERVLQILDA